MTDEQIKAWKHERDMARSIKNKGDREIALRDCYDNRDEMMMTCIAHQSQRGKEQGKKIEEIMTHHDAMVKSHKTFQEMLIKEKGEKEGYKKIFAVIKWIIALGSGGGIGALLTSVLGG